MTFKKLLAIILTVILIICALPIGAFNLVASAETSGYYTYTVSNNEATITDCDTSISGNVAIPSTLGGYPVTNIGNYAFSYCSGLKSIIIPDSVTTIGTDAFNHCDKLTSITIGSGVKNIKGYYGFVYCESLTSVRIKNLATWCEIDFENYWCNPLYTAKTLYINDTLATDITIPNGVTEIKKFAFAYCNSITSVKMPDSVKRVGASSFQYCNSLKTVEFGKGIEYIGSSAFVSCYSLNNVYINNLYGWCNVEADGIEASPLSALGVDIKNVYLNGKLIVDLVIPEGITEINYCAFYKVPSLKSVTIPDTVETISKHAFRYCSKIEKLSIGSGLKYIDDSAFESVRNLKHVCYNGTQEQWSEVYIGRYNDYANITQNITHYNSDETIFKLNKIAPGCTTKGYLSCNCSLCDYEYVIQSVEANGHCCVPLNVVAPTCFEQGYTHYICLACDYEYNSDYVSKLEHKKDEFVRSVEATCTQKGYSVYTCSICENEFNSDYSNLAKHFYVNNTNGKVACKDCNSTLESSHNYYNNTHQVWEVSIPEATNISITFSPKTKTEGNYDYITIYDASDNELGTYSGTTLASKTISVTGSYLKIVLDSDDSEKYYGFDVVKINATFNAVTLVKLRNTILGVETQTFLDINLDGKIDIIDLIHLKKKIAGIIA